MAAPRCKICAHPAVHQINAELATKTTTNVALAAKYGFSEAAVRRHRDNHLPAVLQQATIVEDGKPRFSAEDVWTQLKQVNVITLNILKDARQSGNTGTALSAIARLEKQAELIMRLLGELNESPNVNVLIANNPQWLQIRTVLLDALSPYPEARIAVADALRRIQA